MPKAGARYDYDWTGGEAGDNNEFCSGSRLVLHHRQEQLEF